MKKIIKVIQKEIIICENYLKFLGRQSEYVSISKEDRKHLRVLIAETKEQISKLHKALNILNK